jgi:hypothetical protein
MPVINYQNVAVSVGGSALFANSASFSFEKPIEPIRSLGQRLAIAEVPNGAVQGTVNIEYAVSNNIGKQIFDSIIGNSSQYRGTTISIGGRTFTGYLSSHNVTAEVNSVVNASISFTVFGELPNGGIGSSTPGSSQNVPIGHGSNTSIGIADAIGFEYSCSVEWEPVYLLGVPLSTAPQVLFRSAQETMQLRGHNLGSAVTNCGGDANTVNASVGANCGGSVMTIGITNGKILNSETSVSAGGFVEGSYTIVKNY